MSAPAVRSQPRPRHLPPAISLEEAVRRNRRALGLEGAGNGYVQDALAVDFAAAADEQFFGPQRTPRADLPEPRAWSARITHALLEVMTGVRPAPQVVRWTTPEVYAVVARRSALAARRMTSGGAPRARQRLQVVRVLVCEPVDGVVEASVVVQHGPRVRAVALRLVGQDGKWRVSALQVG